MEGLEVVDDPADGLDVGVLGLPLVMAAVVSSFHNIHATTEVRLFIHHPPKEKKRRNHSSVTSLMMMMRRPDQTKDETSLSGN